jgi:hypothetical protein
LTTISVPIKDFALGIFDGPHATPKPSEQGPVFLGIKNVTEDGRLDFSEVRHVSEAEFEAWTRRVTPKQDDIVFSYEATLHRYARIPDNFLGCLGRRMALVRPNIEKVDPKFLHYYFLSPIWKAKMDAITIIGATVNRIPLTIFPNVKVDFPGLSGFATSSQRRSGARRRRSRTSGTACEAEGSAGRGTPSPRLSASASTRTTPCRRRRLPASAKGGCCGGTDRLEWAARSSTPR